MLLDLESRADLLKVEINETVTKRERGRAEHANQQRHADVGKFYHILKSDAKSARILPPLPDFRRLPFILHLQSKDAPSILGDLRTDSNSLDSALQIDLNAWVKKQRVGFERLLGYENWRDPNPNILSPTERISALFTCTRCEHVPRKIDEQGSFGFISACAHECKNISKRARRDYGFTCADFQADLKVKLFISIRPRLRLMSYYRRRRSSNPLPGWPMSNSTWRMPTRN